MVCGLLSCDAASLPAGAPTPVTQGTEWGPSKSQIPVRVRAGVRPSGPAPRSLADRLWSKVDRSRLGPGGCWEWTGHRTAKGYGSIQCRGRATGYGGPVQTHRLAYLLAVGPLADGEEVRHRCHNRACCNPDHLTPGTHAENIADMVAADRQAKGEDNGNAKLTVDQVGEMRTLRSAGGKVSRLAERFGVSPSLVSQICAGKLWRIPASRTAVSL